MSQLSVGERQQLELVRLLSLGVNVLILDEPTTGISAHQKDALFAALKQLAEAGRTTIFVSHKLEDVQSLCDRATIMRQGRAVGEVELPCSDHTVLELMFGGALAEPSKPVTVQEGVRLRLENVRVGGDRLQLHVEALAIAPGEVIGCAGLEGNGQQLLLLACAGLLTPSAGTLWVDGMELGQSSYGRFLEAGVRYVPADRLKDGLISGLSICEHVMLRSSDAGWFLHRSAAMEQTQTAIAHYNIRGQAHTRVERLSGGNQQRTQLALLPPEANVLLMEHPTRGLDIESALWVWQQLLERCKSGTSIVFASSDLDEVVQYSDRVLVFSGGQMSEPILSHTITADDLGRKIGGNLDL